MSVLARRRMPADRRPAPAGHRGPDRAGRTWRARLVWILSDPGRARRSSSSAPDPVSAALALVYEEGSRQSPVPARADQGARLVLRRPAGERPRHREDERQRRVPARSARGAVRDALSRRVARPADGRAADEPGGQGRVAADPPGGLRPDERHVPRLGPRRERSSLAGRGRGDVGRLAVRDPAQRDGDAPRLCRAPARRAAGPSAAWCCRRSPASTRASPS